MCDKWDNVEAYLSFAHLWACVLLTCMATGLLSGVFMMIGITWAKFGLIASIIIPVVLTVYGYVKEIK